MSEINASEDAVWLSSDRAVDKSGGISRPTRNQIVIKQKDRETFIIEN